MNNNKETTDYASEEVMLRDYYLRHDGQKPDVEAELEAFKSKHFHSKTTTATRSIYWLVASVAASIIMFMYIIYKDGDVAATSSDDNMFMAYEYSDDVVSGITVSNGSKTMVVSDRKFDYAQKGEGVSEGMETISTPYGTTVEVTLSDGTEVTLNAGSKITFPTNFTGSQRNVEVEGEAFFKVARDSVHPFIVKANSMNVRVVGTEFNVRAFKSVDVSVALVSGKVDVSTASTVKHLQPGEGARLDDNGTLVVENIDVEETKSWIDGEFYFDNKDMLTIARVIGRWYGVNVVFTNMEHMHDKMFFSASRYDSLSDIVDVINSFDHVQMKLEKDKLVIN